jgi:hypothetical protein
MAGNKRRGQLINLAQRRRRRMAEALVEARGRMIEAEHALFVALRMAGHEAAPDPVPGCVPFGPTRRANRPANPNVLPLFPRGKRAA